MVKLGRWFSFSSEQEKKAHEQEYFLSVFPFGEPQKQLEQELLRSCICAPVSENEKMYQLLLVKNLYSQSKQTALEDGLRKWYRAPLLKKWPDSDRAALLSLAQLSLKAETFETLPDTESVRSRASEIEQNLLPKLQSKGKRIQSR